MKLPARDKLNYTATIRVVVSDAFGSSDFIDLSVKVGYVAELLLFN